MKKGKLIVLVSALSITSASAAILSAQHIPSPIKASADGEIHVGSWSALNDAIDDAGDGATIVLDADITSSGGKNDRIKINKKDNLTIDLNGHTVDRALTDDHSNGHAFEISGSSDVTIKSTGEKALVKGGYAENGGAVNIHDGSTASFDNIKFDGNKASSDGGAIYTRGVLNMTNCIISNNSADDTGGAIYVTDDGAFDLDGVTITMNTAKDDGGAIRAHLDDTSYIKNSAITKNKSKKGDGGAISLDADGELLVILDSEISENEASGKGGAIEHSNGQIDIDRTVFSQNMAGKGGAIYADDIVNIDMSGYEQATEFNQNFAQVGGAIYVNKVDFTLHDGVFNGNKATDFGGAIYIDGNTTDVRAGTFTNNEAERGSGGAIYIGKKATLLLNGGTFTNNVATASGGAIFYPEEAKALKIKGAITIQGNAATRGADLYVDEDEKIDVVGSLEGSRIGVSTVNLDGTITKGYGENNKVDDVIVGPSAYFFGSDNGYDVNLTGSGEVELKEAEVAPAPSDPYLSYPFISDGQNVVRNAAHLGGNNWMAGISGERYLNEINIPGTHDTAMRSIGTEAGTGSWMSWGAEYAITQKRYIPEQFEGGVRYLDIRLNNRIVLEENKFLPNDVGDDGVHLWQCHGKTIGGTYWADDKEGNLIHLVMVLDWARKFLARNPSECLIMGFGDETYYSENVPIIWSRLRTILNDYKAEYPDVFYLKGDSVDVPYGSMPQLKDVRGKILLEFKNGYGFGCFTSYSSLDNINGTAGQKTDKSAYWDEKVKDVNKFFNDSSHCYDLAKDGGAWAHAGDEKNFFKIGLNCAPQTWYEYPDETPIYHSDRVLSALFDEQGGAFNNIKGRYVGWVKTDGATEKEWGILWKSNFFQDDSDYATITVNPNLDGDNNYKTKTYTVMKNSTIKVPYFNYEFTQGTDDKYFNGWDIGGGVKKFAGDEVIVTEDMTFTAAWTSAFAGQSTSVDVVFRDSDNVDGLRPSSIGIVYNGTGNAEISAENSWHWEATGSVYSVSPVWDGIKGGGSGTDSSDSYRYEVTGDPGNGYVITLIHTASTMIDFGGASTVSGQIIWDDEGDYDKMRATPSDIKVGIAEIGSGNAKEFVEKTLVSPSVDGEDANRWNYEISDTSLPKYKDGAEVNYALAIKKVSGWAHFDRYGFAREGNDFTAKSTPTKNYVSVKVRWADDVASRPDSLKVIIKGDGVALEEKSLLSGWSERYAVNAFARAETYLPDEDRTRISSYAIEITGADGNPVAGYLTPVITKTGDSTFDVLMQQEGYDLGPATHVIDLINALGEPVYTPEYRAALDEAREAFKALSEQDQSLVSNILTLDMLELKYMTRFAHLIAIDAAIEELYAGYMSKKVSELNDYTRDVTKNILALSDEDRNSLWYVDHYNAILAHMATVGNVYYKIMDIGDVTLDNACKTRIDEARAAYDALSTAEKATIDNYSDLYNAEAEYFALYFLDATGSICLEGGTGADHYDALNAIWSDLSAKWNALSEDAQAVLKDADGEGAIGDFFARYSHIVNRYDKLVAFTNGPEVLTAHSAGNNVTSRSDTELRILLIVSISAFALIAGSVIFARKRATKR